jgi:hypothetical protein
MIKPILLTIALAAATAANSMTLCPDDPPSLTGSWSLDFAQSLSRSPSQRQTDFNGFSADRQQKIRSAFDGRTFVFSTDSTLAITWSGGSSSATWTLANGVLSVSVDSTDQSWTIVELASDHLILDLGDSGGLFSQLYLNRN